MQDRVDRHAFAGRLKGCIEARNTSELALSRATGIPKSSINRWSSGESVPSSDQLFPLSDALKVSARWLLYGEDIAPPLIDAADADWVSLERFDLRNLNDLEKGEMVGRLPFRKDWLFRQLNRSSGLWLAELPSDYQPDDLTEGDLVVCSDIVDGDGPKDRWLCIFRGAAGVFIGRYTEVPGLIRSSDRLAETIISPSNLAEGEIRPVARIHARLIARL